MEPRLEFAKGKATQALKELEIDSIEKLADLASICLDRGVFVTYQPMRNMEGMLIRPKRLIAVRSDIPELGRTRFTIAHELGHWEMHPGLNQLQICSSEEIHAYRGSAFEIEANTFAAQLLMPDFMLTEQLRFLSPTLETVKKLAHRFQTSLTATAVRMCEYTDLPVIVAFSSGGKLRWYRRSHRATGYWFMRIGAELSGDTLARYCTDEPDDPSAPEEVESSAWFPDDHQNDRFKVHEESVELGAYGTTLSIITIDD